MGRRRTQKSEPKRGRVFQEKRVETAQNATEKWGKIIGPELTRGALLVNLRKQFFGVWVAETRLK